MTPSPSPEPTANPLAEATVDSLAELMARDPLKLSDADVDRIVIELRRKRQEWAKAESEGKAKKAAKSTASPTISLDDLGL